MDYLIDTNILIIYTRANQITQNIEDELRLLTENNTLVISAVSVGEVKSLAIRNKWGSKKIQKLQQLLQHFLIADVNVEEIIDRYAEIDAYSQGKLPNTDVYFSARNMGKNDLWIAATGSVLNLVLITTDNDFDHLHGNYLTIQKIVLEKYLEKK